MGAATLYGLCLSAPNLCAPLSGLCTVEDRGCGCAVSRGQGTLCISGAEQSYRLLRGPGSPRAHEGVPSTAMTATLRAGLSAKLKFKVFNFGLAGINGRHMVHSCRFLPAREQPGGSMPGLADTRPGREVRADACVRQMALQGFRKADPIPTIGAVQAVGLSISPRGRGQQGAGRHRASPNMV